MQIKQLKGDGKASQQDVLEQMQKAVDAAGNAGVKALEQVVSPFGTIKTFEKASMALTQDPERRYFKDFGIPCDTEEDFHERSPSR